MTSSPAKSLCEIVFHPFQVSSARLCSIPPYYRRAYCFRTTTRLSAFWSPDQARALAYRSYTRSQSSRSSSAFPLNLGGGAPVRAYDVFGSGSIDGRRHTVSPDCSVSEDTFVLSCHAPYFFSLYCLHRLKRSSNCWWMFRAAISSSKRVASFCGQRDSCSLVRRAHLAAYFVCFFGFITGCIKYPAPLPICNISIWLWEARRKTQGALSIRLLHCPRSGNFDGTAWPA